MELLEKERLDRLKETDPALHAAAMERIRLLRERRRAMPLWRRVLDILIHDR